MKQAYRAPEGVQRGCWDLMDDLAAGFWAVYPEETAQRCCGSNWTLRADNVAGMVTPSSIRQLLVGEYLMHTPNRRGLSTASKSAIRTHIFPVPARELSPAVSMAGGLHWADRGCSSGRCGAHRQIRDGPARP